MAVKLKGDTIIDEAGKTLLELTNEMVSTTQKANTNATNITNVSNVVNNKTSQLVAEVVLTQASQVMEITGLDIKRDGGVYDIVIAEWSSVGTGRGHYLQINGKGSGYSGRHRYVWSNNPSSWVLSNHSGCLAFTNGWSMGEPLFYTVGTLVYFNHDWIYFTSRGGTATNNNARYVDVQCDTQLHSQNIQNITSIRVVCTDSDYIGVGSYMKIYKRSKD